MARLYYPIMDLDQLRRLFRFQSQHLWRHHQSRPAAGSADGGPYTPSPIPSCPMTCGIFSSRTARPASMSHGSSSTTPIPPRGSTGRTHHRPVSLWRHRQESEMGSHFQYGKTTNNATTYNVAIYDAWQASRSVIADPATVRPFVPIRSPGRPAAFPSMFPDHALQPGVDRLYHLLPGATGSRPPSKWVGGDISGSAFFLPYGDLQFTVGLESRKRYAERKGDPRDGGPGAPQTSKVGIIRQWGGQAPVLNDLDVSQRHRSLCRSGRADAEGPSLRASGADRGGLSFLRYANGIGNYRYLERRVIWSPFDGLSFRRSLAQRPRAEFRRALYAADHQLQRQSGRPLSSRQHRPDRGPPGKLRGPGCPRKGLDNYPLGPDITSGGNPALKRKPRTA